MARTKADRLAAIKTMGLLMLEQGSSLTDVATWLVDEIEHVLDPHFTTTFRCKHPQLKLLLAAVKRKRNRVFFDVELTVEELPARWATLNDTEYRVTIRYATRPQAFHLA